MPNQPINYYMPEEDEIDLKDLIRTLLRNKKTIILMTTIVTLLAVVYSLVKTPTYEVRSIISIGGYEGKLIEAPQTLVARNTIVYIDNAPKEDYANLEKVILKKGTPNLIEFVVRSDSNENAIKKLDDIVGNTFKLHTKEITKYKGYNNKEIDLIVPEINLLKKQKETMTGNNELINGINTKIFDLENSINSLKNKNSEQMIDKTQKVGAYIINEHSIAPKKKLIVIIAFVTGFIFSIFFVFLREFIVHFNDDLKEEDA